LLKKEGFDTQIEHSRIEGWRPDELIFSARRGDTLNAWRIPIRSDFRVWGKMKQLTARTEMDVHPPVLFDGRILFANLTRRTDIWIVPVDANRVRSSDKLRRVTDASGVHEFPSLSLDGKLLAYSSLRYGNRRMWIKDLEDGAEKEATAFKGNSAIGELSPDGKQLYCVVGKDRFSSPGGGNGFIGPLRGGPVQPFCSDCIKPWDVSDDNEVVLYRKNDKTARAFYPATHQDKLFLQDAKYDLYQPKFSPDRHWLALEAVESAISRLFVAALGPGDQIAPEKGLDPLVPEPNTGLDV
jgi:WD40-like Beta Propeller Repeat